jgi:hypothetical protein
MKAPLTLLLLVFAAGVNGCAYTYTTSRGLAPHGRALMQVGSLGDSFNRRAMH